MALKTLALAVVSLLFIPIAISLKDHEEMKPEEAKRNYGEPSTPLPEKPCGQLCIGTVSNRTIKTKNGKAICLVPAVDDLIEQLNKIGGYNRHYVAITMEEAKANFDNLLPKEKETTPTFPPSPGYGGYHKRPHKGRWRRRRRRRGHSRGRGRGRGRGRTRVWGHIHNLRTSGDASAEDHDFIGRQKRQADSSLDCLKPKCIFPKDSTVDGYRTCPLCQRCKELDPTFFPRIVNEVTCDSSASGYSKSINCSPSFIGKCKQNTMTIDVLSKEPQKYELIKKEGSDLYFLQIWQRKSIAIKSCCECYGNRDWSEL